MALQFLLNNVDLSSRLRQDDWSVQENFGRQGSTASFTLIDEHVGEDGAPDTWNVAVAPLSTVKLTDLTLGKTLFAGLCVNPVMTWQSPILNTWALECKDFTDYADKAYVFGDFRGMSADAIARSLITQAVVGYTTANIQPAPSIPRVKVKWQ